MLSPQQVTLARSEGIVSGYGGAWQVGIREDELRTEAVSEGLCV